MKLRRGTAVAAMVIGAMTVALGTANADPAPAPAPAANAKPGIDYSTKLVDKTVVTRLKNGTFELVDRHGATPDQKQQVVDIKDQAGNVALEMPLDFRVLGVPIPVKPVLKDNGSVLELTPDKPVNAAHIDLSKPLAPAPIAAVAGTKAGQAEPIKADKPVLAQDIASPIENQRAMNDFATKFGLATAIGGFLGTATGVVVGAVVGCILGLPLFGVGCIPAAVAGAGIGGILGTVAVGGPALVAAGVELLQTIQAPNGTSQWSDAAMAAAGGQQQQPAK